MDRTRIASVMTRSPPPVAATGNLSEAADRMHTLGLRHLPVVHEGAFVGLLAQRDVDLVTALPGVDAEQLPVSAAMTGASYIVTPDTALSEVVRAMIDGDHGCAVVVEDGVVTGWLTRGAALLLLWERLLTEPDPTGDLAPSKVREVIAAEHGRIRQLLNEVDTVALLVLDGDEDSAGALREQSRRLYEVLGRHIDLEDRVLAPALRETPGFGEVRAKQLLEHHAAQRIELETAIERLGDKPTDARALARDIRALVGDIRVDMAHEDRDLLSPNLLRDDPIEVGFLG